MNKLSGKAGLGASQGGSSAMEGATVFFFHPTKAWELAVVIGTTQSSVAHGRGAAEDHTLISVKERKSGEKHDVKPSLVYNPTSGVETLCPDNLLSLPELHHSILLNALRLRHGKDEVYSNMGELIVAVNPFKYTIPWYLPNMMEKYLEHTSSATVPVHLKPHTWCVAHRAYVNTVQKKLNHSIIVSGESGAGKTEACKMVLNYICHAAAQHAAEERRELTEKINRKVQQSNPILEAFGNAKTGRNDNSSRFGKFLEIQLDHRGRLVGMKVTPYLLEKSRIIGAGQDERVFHIYYQLISGASEELKAELRLKSLKDFRMLSSGGTTVVRGVDDREDFEAVQTALCDLDFTQEEQHTIWRLLAAILHLTNVEYSERRIDGKAEVSPNSQLVTSFVCTELLRLNCSPQEFDRDLTKQRKTVGKEVVYSELTKQKAEDQRDTICKFLYSQLFLWIIHRINKATTASALLADAPASPASPPGSSSPTNPPADGSSGGDGAAPAEAAAPPPSSPRKKDTHIPKAVNWIGLLDIYGFEDFVNNSFEQFCINLANESLQRHYSRFQFEKDVEDVQREGIKCKAVSFQDNQPCLDLVMGDKNSVISMLDDASTLDFERTKSNPPDRVFLDALTSKHKPDYQTVGAKGTKSVLDRGATDMKKPSDFFDRGRLDDDAFVIRHYAGNVKYRVKAFVEKNVDALKEATKETLTNSRDTALVDILELLEEEVTSGGGFDASPSSPTSPRSKATVASRFRRSLRDLLAMLDQTVPNWIRCIRPHPKKQPGMWDGRAVLEQLVASGVLETIEQRQRNFPYRIPLNDFLGRYAVVSMAGGGRRVTRTSVEERCKTITSVLGVDPTHAQVGKTKVFLQSDAYGKIEQLRREKIEKHVKHLAQYLRMRDSRHIVSFLRYRKVALSVQRIFRQTRKFRVVIAKYYHELCEKIRARLAAERKAIVVEETSTRQGIGHLEHTDTNDLVRSFRTALAPMVAAVLRNIQRVEEKSRTAINKEENSEFEQFPALFEESEIQYRGKYEARRKREKEEALAERKRFIQDETDHRSVILVQERAKREALAARIIPEQEAIHERASRIQELQRQRDKRVAMLEKELDREKRRLERDQRRREEQEANSWRRYVGDEGLTEEVRYFARQTLSPGEAQQQIRRFYASGAPSTIIAGDGLGGEARSYQQYSEMWRTRYRDETQNKQQYAALDIDAITANASTPQRYSLASKYSAAASGGSSIGSGTSTPGMKRAGSAVSSSRSGPRQGGGPVKGDVVWYPAAPGQHAELDAEALLSSPFLSPNSTEGNARAKPHVEPMTNSAIMERALQQRRGSHSAHTDPQGGRTPPPAPPSQSSYRVPGVPVPSPQPRPGFLGPPSPSVSSAAGAGTARYSVLGQQHHHHQTPATAAKPQPHSYSSSTPGIRTPRERWAAGAL